MTGFFQSSDADDLPELKGTSRLSAFKQAFGRLSHANQFGTKFRLRYKILACVFISILFTEFIVIGVSYLVWNRDQFNRLDQETLLMLKANVEATSYPSINEILKMGERIISFSDVKGGTIYNRLGEKVASFGKPPALSMLTFQRENIRHYIPSHNKELEVFYSAEATGFANAMVVRIDAAGVPAVLQQHLKDKAMTTLAIGFVSSIAIVFMLSFSVVRPVLQLRRAVAKATDDPNHADKARLNWKRGDEFGDVAKALDLLFTTVSVVYQEDLAAGQEAMHRAAFSVLNYDARGNIISANNSALKMFGVVDFHDLLGKAGHFIRQVEDETTTDVSPLALIEDQNALRTVNIVTKEGIKRCIMNGVIARHRNGTKLRTIVTLVDISAHASKIEDMRRHVGLLEDRDVSLTRRMGELRSLFQSCMILLSHSQAQPAKPDKTESDNSDHLADIATLRPVTLVDRIVNKWYSEASRAHLIDSAFRHEVLPPAYGTPEEIQAIFSQGFMYIYSQARVDKPVIRVQAEKVDDKFTTYKIWEEQKSGEKLRAVDETLAAGASLTIASMRQSLNVLQGQLKTIEPHAVEFILRTGSFKDVKFTQNGMTPARQQA